MSINLQTLINKHHAFYEVLPYYVVQPEQKHGSSSSTKRIQAGFDIDVFGTRSSNEQTSGQDYGGFYTALETLIENFKPQASKSCSIQVVAFPSRVVIDTKRQFQELGMLRIRIAHTTLDEPAGVPEEHALREIKDRLNHFGLSQR